MALITATQVDARLGRAMTGTEAARLDALIADVSAAICSYTGQQFIEDETTLRVRARNGRIRLPQYAISAVSAVQTIEGVDLAYTWDGLTLTLGIPYVDPFEWNVHPYTDRVVDVTYEHGYATIPDDIVAVACQMVIRALGNEPDEAGISQETIGTYSYSRGSVAAAGPFGMFDSERAVLDRYRQPALPVPML